MSQRCNRTGVAQAVNAPFPGARDRGRRGARMAVAVLGRSPTVGRRHTDRAPPPPLGRRHTDRAPRPPWARPHFLETGVPCRPRRPDAPGPRALNTVMAARTRQDRRSPDGLVVIYWRAGARRSMPALLRVRGHHDHRIPAPTVRANDASIATAQVKRARFAFTDLTPLESFGVHSDRRQPGGLREEDPWLCVPASRRVCPGRVILVGGSV